MLSFNSLFLMKLYTDNQFLCVWVENISLHTYYTIKIGKNMPSVTQGSGCIILAKNTRKILLPHRSKQVGQPNTWGTWGGFINPDEDPQEAAIRELREESGYDGNIELIKLSTMNWFVFKYHNFFGIIDEEFTPYLNWENQDYKWVEFGNWPTPIHFGLQWLLEKDAQLIDEIMRRIIQYP